MKRYLFTVLAIILVIGLILTGCAQSSPSSAPAAKPPASSAATSAAAPPPAAQAKAVDISYVSFLPKNNPSIQLAIGVLDNISKKSGGQVTFTHKGGPEAIDPLEQGTSVKRGSVDAAIVPVDLYTALVAPPSMFTGAEIEAAQDRDTGAYDFANELYQKAGLRLILREPCPAQTRFQMITTKAVTKPSELAGLKLGGTALWGKVAESLQMKPVQVLQAEYYSSLDRGVIDAVCTAPATIAALKLNEVAKNLISPPFFSSTMTFIMNLDKWNSLPKDLQNTITNSAFAEAPNWATQIANVDKAAVKTLTDGGVKVVTFSDADAATYVATLKKAAYDFYVDKAPVDGPKLYQMLQKSALKK
jgi:TRAP-type transport system periplasmic protein